MPFDDAQLVIGDGPEVYYIQDGKRRSRLSLAGRFPRCSTAACSSSATVVPM
jgi:hypothetical protein